MFSMKVVNMSQRTLLLAVIVAAFAISSLCKQNGGSGLNEFRPTSHLNEEERTDLFSVRSLPQAVTLPDSTVPCTEESCETECMAAGATKGENVTTTSSCLKSSGACNCCILPDCEVICQQRRRKERPRSKEVRSRCTEKGECYCNFLWFDTKDGPTNSP
ncbi:hypothetical protein BIW11_03384 [Tropilaelaps mercedesae]|uniref:Uncharacterized protein n=1 Tax=Tropilaelaps mercedesae TaxID=418985 RepID=A0A1V9XMF2_9ACAR|nr:hypothetical protein BIW11_03384 [Tropilaelaps mercedesae]